MLDFKLVHDTSERLLKLVDLLVELLAHLHLQLVIELLVDADAGIVLVYFDSHLLNHFLHLSDLGRNLNYLVLQFGVLEDTL